MEDILSKSELFADKMIALCDSGKLDLSLLKTESMNAEIKKKIGLTLSSIDQNKEMLDQMKQAKPEAYQAVMELIQTMIDLVKQTTGDDPTSMMHENQIKDSIGDYHNQQQQEEEQQNPQQAQQGGLPAKDEKLHNRKLVYAPGSERRYSSQDDKIKDQDGNWNSFKGGLKAPTEGQNE